MRTVEESGGSASPASAAAPAIAAMPASSVASATTVPAKSAYATARMRSTGVGPKRSTCRPEIGAPTPTATA